MEKQLWEVYKSDAVDVGIQKQHVHYLDDYFEPHRFYHNADHIDALWMKAREKGINTDHLFLAILFHDIVYNPKANNNEEASAELLKKCLGKNAHKFKDSIQAILDTKTHKPTNKISKQLCELDLAVLNGTFEEFVDFENKIFKEYQFADYSAYLKGRVKVLKDLGVKQEFINYVKYRKPNIAVYAGSFNPFHKGHLNILQKAEQIFDKVIIAQGLNPEKTTKPTELPLRLFYHQCETYDGLLTDFISKLDYPVTLIRGLRNAADLQYEQTQYRFLQDLKPDIKVVSIFCDKEFEHISSSAIRQLKKYGKGIDYLI